MNRIDHKSYIASLTPDTRATLLDRLLAFLPVDGALEGAEELVWIVEHMSAASEMLDDLVQRELRLHRETPDVMESREIELRVASMKDDGWMEKVMEKVAEMERDERREKRRAWFRKLWRRLVGRR